MLIINVYDNSIRLGFAQEFIDVSVWNSLHLGVVVDELIHTEFNLPIGSQMCDLIAFLIDDDTLCIYIEYNFDRGKNLLSQLRAFWKNRQLPKFHKSLSLYLLLCPVCFPATTGWHLRHSIWLGLELPFHSFALRWGRTRSQHLDSLEGSSWVMGLKLACNETRRCFPDCGSGAC